MADPSLVERYIRGEVMPRFMARLREIEDELARHRSRLATAYDDVWETCEGDPQAFSQRWRALAHSWRFDHVNTLIGAHNEYYPIERRLPINPRTGDYLTTSGRPWRREPAGPEWVLERFPAQRRAAAAREVAPKREPRPAARRGAGAPSRATRSI